jgi:hypothetical protein
VTKAVVPIGSKAEVTVVVTSADVVEAAAR